MSCFSNFKVIGKFTNLEIFKLFNANKKLKGNLLGKMPNLKKLIIYTKFDEDVEHLDNQKKLHRLNELDIVLFGFKGKRVCLPVNNSQIVLIDDSYICELFDNYSNLVENSIWQAQINYFKLVQLN